MSKNGTQSNTIKKRLFLEALEKSLGVVAPACKSVGISRTTFYRWVQSDREFKNSVEEIDEVALDTAESELYSLIKQGVFPAICFYLKTRGKRRGYVERSEIDVSSKAPDLSELSTKEIKDLLESGTTKGIINN